MGNRLRYSVSEALSRGLINTQEAKALRASHAPGEPGGGDNLALQRQVYDACLAKWPEAVVWELKNAIPGRKFQLDIAFPDDKLAIEIDGYQYHARSLEGFKNTLDRQNVLVIAGWRVLRFYKERIMGDLPGIIREIALAREAVRRDLSPDDLKTTSTSWRKRAESPLIRKAP